MKRPWETNSKDAWEECGNFESWLREQMPDSLEETIEDVDPVFMSNLYAVFCNIYDELKGG